MDQDLSRDVELPERLVPAVDLLDKASKEFIAKRKREIATTDRLGRLLDAIASREPAPASGSAAAAVVATAAALLEKVARLSSKRWSGAAEALADAHATRLRAEELVEHDLHAFLAYMDAMRSGQDVDAAWGRTVDVPLDIVRTAAQVVQLAEQLAAKGNPKLRADAVAAAMLAAAGADTAAMLIAVNVGTAGDIRFDEAASLAEEALEGARSLRPQGS